MLDFKFTSTSIAVVSLLVVCSAASDDHTEWFNAAFTQCRDEAAAQGISGVLRCTLGRAVEQATGGADLRALARMWQSPSARPHIVAKCVETVLSKLADPSDLRTLQATLGHSSLSQLTQHLMKPRLASLFPADASSSSSASDYLFWRFIPPFKGNAVPGDGSNPLRFTSSCFRNISVEAKYVNHTVHLDYSADGQTGLLCIDVLLFNAAGTLHVEVLIFDEKKDKHVAITPKALAGVEWVVQNRGVQVFSFDELVTAIVSFLQTFSLFFGPMTSYHPSASDALNNAIFQNLYNTQDPLWQPIGGSGSGSSGSNSTARISNPQTGDVLLIGRMDGEDTLTTWLMGSNIPHVAIIVCNDSQVGCQVCETRFQSLWWPVEGVQCNPLDQWLEWAAAGAMLVTHLPGKDGLAGNISVAAVLNYTTANAGTTYGYPSVLWGWIDTADGSNFPCLPPDFASHCVAFEHLEAFYLFIDTLSSGFAWYLGGSGFSQRVGGGYSLGVAEALKVGATQFGWTPQQIAAQPELDDYIYYGLKNGDVYYGRVWTDSGLVCSLLRQGGPLSSFPEHTALNCAELTVWNLLRLDFWNASQAHQVLGDYSLMPMGDVGTVPPYSGMGNSCPGHPPHYQRPANC